MRAFRRAIGCTLAVSAFVGLGTGACGDEKFYQFGFQSEEMLEEDLGSGSWKYWQAMKVVDLEAAERQARRVETVVTTKLARGARTWDTESINYQGRKVGLQHDDVKKQLTVSVDGRELTVRQQPNRKYLYGSTYYGDQPTEVRRLAQAIAHDLLAFNVPKDGLVGAINSSREAQKRTADKDKLFFTFAFVDVLDNVESIVGIEAGAIPVDVDIDADADVL